MTADAPPGAPTTGPVAARTADGANSLGGVLERLFASDDGERADFVQRLGRLAFDLTGARYLTVFSDDIDAPPLHGFGAGGQGDLDRELAARALAEDKVVASPPFAIAVCLPTARFGRVVLAASMPPGNTVLASLAYERLELLRAICRERALAKASAVSERVLEDAAAVASGDWERAQALVDALSASAGGAVCSLLEFSGARLAMSGQIDLPLRASLGEDIKRRGVDARKRSEPAPGERLLGAPNPSHMLLIEGPDAYLAAVAPPLAAVFTGAGRRASWTRRHRGKLRAGAAVCLLALVGLIPVGDGVNLPAAVAVVNARIVTAPFDGRIADVQVREGDAVIGGQTVLLQMDTSDLDLSLAEARAGLTGALTRRDSLRGRANAADRRDAEFAVRRESLKVEAIRQKIARAKVTAPIDGVVQGQDLAAQQGAFIGLGGEILRVVDPNALRIEVAIDARARARIATGDDAAFRADSAPATAVPITLASVAVSPEAEGPDPIYPAFSQPLAAPGSLRPGMQGVARVEFDDAPLALIMWRRLRDWAILTFWL